MTQLRLYGLQTEQRHEPLGVGESRPRLSWKLDSDRRGAAQSAYRITAAERAADLDDNTRLLWDSGRRESGDTLLVLWDGPLLRSATRYHWRVEVWDETGAPAASAQTWFETALLHREDWPALWIGRDPLGLPPVDPPGDDDPSASVGAPPLYLRREFTVDRQPLRARLYATARGIYEPRLNGCRIGDMELAPGWTEYRRRLQYQTYDVTELVHEGANVLGAIVADGWWCGYVGFDGRRPARHYGDSTAFLAQLVIDFADGSRQVVGSDARWTERPGAIRSADLLMGQHVDARQEVSGWDTPLTSGAGFQPVAVLDADLGSLVAEPDQPVRVTREIAAINIQEVEPGRFIVDFGQNLTGRVRLAMRRAEPGQRIVLRHAEILADGALTLGRHREADEYRDLHTAIRAAFIESYVRDDGTVEGDTQTGYLLALAFGLIPEDLVPAAVEHLAADIEKRGTRLTTGFLGVALLCPILADHGRADLAYALLHQEEFPSWGYSIRHGATTIWERWDGWTEHGGFQSAAMNSFNHYSLGSVGDWLFARVAGIDQTPMSVAYRELLLRPLPGGPLTWARAEQDTARGRVACGWSIDDGQLTVTVVVPPGSTAVLEIPTAAPDSVRESGLPVADQPGVLKVETSAGGVTLRLTSGRYVISAVAPIPSTREKS